MNNIRYSDDNVYYKSYEKIKAYNVRVPDSITLFLVYSSIELHIQFNSLYICLKEILTYRTDLSQDKLNVLLCRCTEEIIDI